MRIPQKITPDGLTDAVVVVRYAATETPPEVLLDEFYRVFKQHGFSYLPAIAKARPAGAVEESVFFNDAGVLISVRAGQLLFNGVVQSPSASTHTTPGPGRYIGWLAYRQVLADVLEPLLAAKILPGFSWVAVRYINILPWAPPAEQLRIPLVLPVPEGLETLPSFESRLNWPPTPDGFQVSVRITDQLPTAKAEYAQGRHTLFDVSVTRRSGGSSFVELQNALDTTHQKQKEVFFGLLSHSFLNTLQPEYNPS